MTMTISMVKDGGKNQPRGMMVVVTIMDGVNHRGEEDRPSLARDGEITPGEEDGDLASLARVAEEVGVLLGDHRANLARPGEEEEVDGDRARPARVGDRAVVITEDGAAEEDGVAIRHGSPLRIYPSNNPSPKSLQ